MSDLLAVKFVDGSEDTIEGMILPYGGPMNGKDLTGTYFTPKTDFAMKWFPEGGRPGLYRHGFDPAAKTSVIGRELSTTPTEKGYWLKAQLDASHEYANEIKELVRQGKLFLSSGAVDHLVDVKEKTGEIRSWPYVEWSLTPRPANPDQPPVAFREAPVAALAATGGYTVKSLDAAAHLSVLGVRVPRAIKSWLPEGTAESDLADADFAFVSTKEGVRRFPYRVDDKVNRRGWRLAVRDAIAAPRSSFRRGPTRRAVLERLLRARPKGVELSAKELAGLPTPILRAAVREWVREQRRPSTKEGRRNSSTDASTLQGAHDAIASVLSLDCAPSGAGKEAAIPAPHVLAIKTASDGPAQMDESWLDSIREQASEQGRVIARQMTGRSATG